MSQLTEKVDFDRIRYANCWEDADLLLTSLQLQPGSKVLCIASAGDNALALLSTAPSGVKGVDLSAPQLYLTELKQMAIRNLEYEELLQLLGVTAAPDEKRRQLFDKAATTLSAAAKNYWTDHKNLISTGLLGTGKFEHYFELFRKWLLPLVHNRQTIGRLLAPKTDAGQQDFYHKHWNTWRWKLLISFFFSRRIMGKYGRDPEFLRHVNISVPQYIRNKAEQHLQSSLATRNYFLHFIFKGMFGNGLPFYLRPENFATIRQHIDRLSLTLQDATAAVRAQHFDACCLSNIFEYFSAGSFQQTVAEWAELLQPQTRLTFWNLMAPRSFAATAPHQYRSLPADTAADKGFFYSQFLLEERL